MADDVNVNNEKRENYACSFENSSTLPIFSKIKTPKVEDNYELRWPALEERDLTQIITEDATTKSNIDISSGEASEANQENKFRRHPEINRIQVTNGTSYPEENRNVSLFGSTKKHQGQLDSEQGNKDIPLESHKIDYWNVLSDEVILGVFTVLSKRNVCVCARVCKRWRRLAYDESLWQSLDLSGSAISEDSLQHLLARGVIVIRLAWLQVLSSENCKTLNESDTEKEQDTRYNVQYLDASLCTVAENILVGILSKCRSLKKLSLESCLVSTGILRAIGRCNQLSVLDLCMCKEVTKRGLQCLATGCQRITELNLGWTNITPESISTVVQSFPLLIKLNLSGCRETLHDEAIAELLATCRNLTSLDLSDCIEISEDSVKTIVKQGKMKHLALSRCYGITPKCLESLSSLKSLKSLQVFGIVTDPGLGILKRILTGIEINEKLFSYIARPVRNMYRNAIWGQKCLEPS